MMQYLFGGEYPLFSNIKMEMGNDGNNSTGAEACTKRYEDEEADASRSPGFVMAADAKKINPNVKVSILRWEYPNWVKAKADGTEKYAAIYKWYKETIFDAYEKYGYVVDYIDPDKNETGSPDGEIIKYFANALKNETDFPSYFTEEAKEAYHNIKIVASDENKGLKIVPLMRSDSGVYDAVDAIGFHYRTNATSDYITMADVDDKEVWYKRGLRDLRLFRTAGEQDRRVRRRYHRWLPEPAGPAGQPAQRLCRFPPHDVHVPACDWFLL